ncbi:malate dehydrogenase [Listeria fleischmannii subsp. fleischmannii LU2006-1]|nr:malate dehydrogenase [Listeria fleischmannii subsp. fleischmannii LU2006-1]
MKNKILQNPYLNKGTAFTYAERQKYELDGLLPSEVESIDTQILRVKEILDNIPEALEKNYYLTSIYRTNRTLYFATIQKYLTELLPIIYTPTIGDVVMNAHKHFEPSTDAVYINAFRPETMKRKLQNACENPEKNKKCSSLQTVKVF